MCVIGFLHPAGFPLGAIAHARAHMCTDSVGIEIDCVRKYQTLERRLLLLF